MTVALVSNATGLSGSLQVGGVDSLVFDANGITSGYSLTNTRNTVQYGAITSAGYSGMLSAGTGLAVNLAATSVNMRTTFAAGVQDFIATLTADTAGVVTLPASNLSFVSQDWVSSASVAWNSTLAQPQYGYSFNQAAQAKLDLNNTNLDDFGNTWTNNAVTFSNTSPAIAGTYMGVFNGTSSYMKSTAITSLGKASWTVRCKFIPTSIATTSSLFYFANAANYGLVVNFVSSKISFALSSTGTSFDIANGVAGNTTFVNGTAYDLEVTYDAVAGKYFVYVNGVAESNLTITSASILCPITTLAIGATTAFGQFWAGSIQGFEFLPYCKHPNGVTFTPQTALSKAGTSGYASDFFSIPNMQMYQVSGPSVGVGVNPVFTPKNRVYVGEAVTGTSSVSSVVNYALNGRYDSGLFAVAAGNITYSKTHNIGTSQYAVDISFADDINGTNERVATSNSFTGYGYSGGTATRNQVSVISGSTAPGISTANASATTGFYRVRTRRSF